MVMVFRIVDHNRGPFTFCGQHPHIVSGTKFSQNFAVLTRRGVKKAVFKQIRDSAPVITPPHRQGKGTVFWSLRVLHSQGLWSGPVSREPDKGILFELGTV